MRTIPQNINTDRLKSTKELSDIMHDLLARARRHGATDASVAANHDSGFSVDTRMGEVETVAFSEDNGVSITVYKGHRQGGGKQHGFVT